MKYTWLVEKYLEGELRGEELRNFELEILKNPEVSEEVERIRNLNAFSQKQYALLTTTHELIEDFSDIHLSLEESVLTDDLESMKILEISESDPDYQDFKKKVKPVSLRYYLKTTAKNKILIPGYALWITAACFMLLLTFTLLNIFADKRSENLQDVYASFYKPYQVDRQVRNEGLVPTDSYNMGLNEYLKSNYGSALSYFNEVESGSEVNKSLYLLKGICLMETGKYENAIHTFSFVLNDPLLNDYGEWYMGLSFLKLGQPDKARELFRTMSNREGYFRDISGKVLKRL